ncbi:MAG: sensor histidine kinase [Pseudobacter sp.]|uniref:sensor histidine kinase n=1 Tax=Pseudobacter sp. TaxID=2045420 RepID=UPI003F7FC5B6
MQAERELTGTELAEMLNNSSIDRIMAINPDYNIIAWNSTSERIAGINKDDILGKNLLDVFPAFAEDMEMMTAIRHAFSGRSGFVPAQAQRFNRHYFENHFIPLRNKYGEIAGVMNIMHDVANRIRVEQELQQLNIMLNRKFRELERASDELATVAYITSRNIREPLKHVYSSIELLITHEGQVMSDGGKANLRRIQASLNRMNLLLEDISTLSGITQPEETPEPVDLNLVLQEVLQKLANKIIVLDAKIEVSTLPVITGYKHLLHNLFEYLVTNAIRFRNSDRRLQLSITSTDTDLNVKAPAGATQYKYSRISFIDNGRGFTREDAASMFLLKIILQAPMCPVQHWLSAERS